jgi:hypothetical protein
VLEPIFVKTVSKYTVSLEKVKVPILDSKSSSFLHDVKQKVAIIPRKSSN